MRVERMREREREIGEWKQRERKREGKYYAGNLESFKKRDNGNRIENFENNNETSDKSNFILYGPPVLREDTGNLILIS